MKPTSSRIALAAVALSVTLLGATIAAADSSNDFPPGPGQTQVQAACGPCHAVTVVTSAHKAEAEWARTVDAMVTHGARVADDDYDLIIDYLIRNFSAR